MNNNDAYNELIKHFDISTIAKALFANQLFGIIVTDNERFIRHINQRAVELAGYDKIDELIHQNIRILYFSDDDYMKMQKYYNGMFQRGDQAQVDYKFRGRDGSEVWCSVLGTVIGYNDDGSLKGVIWLIKDITKRVEANEELQTAHNELESIFSNSMIGICLLKGGRFVYRVNKRFLEITGYDHEDEVIGQSVRMFHVSDEAHNNFGNNYYNNLMKHQMVEVDYQFKKKDGSLIWIAISGKAVDPNNPPDLNIGVVWTIKDITDTKAQVSQLEELSITDPLTGLYNRRYFLDRLETLYETFLKTDLPLSLLMIDIDYFKQVNDRYGHDVGDEALIEVSNKCREHVRETDIVCRMGGEEFSVILPYTSQSLAITIAERLRRQVEVSSIMDFDLTISIGIATSIKEEDLYEFIKRADRKLYESKDKGRNRISY